MIGLLINLLILVLGLWRRLVDHNAHTIAAAVRPCSPGCSGFDSVDHSRQFLAERIGTRVARWPAEVTCADRRCVEF